MSDEKLSDITPTPDEAEELGPVGPSLDPTRFEEQTDGSEEEEGDEGRPRTGPVGPSITDTIRREKRRR